jgi:hypothetical protein
MLDKVLRVKNYGEVDLVGHKEKTAIRKVFRDLGECQRRLFMYRVCIRQCSIAADTNAALKKPYSAFLSSSAGLGSWSQFKTNVAIFSS